ncbi:hypothetical protein LH935_06810 [Gordonia polyisoprenivorans]|uniref:hypothetical protein n=1 Tax=Gordonia polyisoprenivorans TaxID=84595 RepID=UPI002234C0E2|nr:hypothetical protein LH935_06810 [Gordonia polyisoprenivorans]
MRIRSTKPEFWRSKTIAALPWDVRLVLKGIESYVDDNGVGKDDIALIAADVFPRDLSANPPETLARLSEAISQLSRGGLVTRYEWEGDDFIYVERWKELQRIDKPTKGRFPRPDGTMNYADPVIRENYRNPREDFGNPPEKVAPGTGEQGNRGTGENTPPVPAQPHQGAGDSKAVARMRELNATSLSAAAIGVARAYDEWAGNGVDSKTRDEVARVVDRLMADNISAHQIADGIKAWHASDSWSPTQIHRFVTKAARPREEQPTATKATLRAVDTLATAEALIAEFHQETA